MREIGERERLHLFVNYATRHSVKHFHSIEERFPDLQELFECAERRQSSALQGIPEGIAQRLMEAAAPGFMERYISWLVRNRVGIALPEHEEYPALLKEIYDPPTVLFYRGTLPEDIMLPISIVGARSCTDYGKDVAKLFSAQLVRHGATIVSGLAAGIDGCAAQGALSVAEADCPTIAVLGSGINVPYPKSNENLYREIIERGVVISEFLPKEEPLSEHFPIRNRVISGLSRGVVVIEAGARSGTSITVNHALEQGRDVFAVPGRIVDAKSIGPNRLIQAGEAKPVFCAEDILCEYFSEIAAIGAAAPGFAADDANLDEQERRIVDVLREGEKSIDDLVEILDVSAAEINSTLTAMEFSGIIKPLPGRIIALELKK